MLVSMKILRLLLALPLLVSYVLSSLPEGNSEDMTNMCPICLNNMVDSDFMTRCGHTFHNECISQCADAQHTLFCPMCRLRVTSIPIIEEIMAEKRKDMKQATPINGYRPYISSEMEDMIKRGDLLGAASVAFCEEDIVALKILCSYVFKGRTVNLPDTSESELIRMILEEIVNVNQVDYVGNPSAIQESIENPPRVPHLRVRARPLYGPHPPPHLVTKVSAPFPVKSTLP